MILGCLLSVWTPPRCGFGSENDELCGAARRHAFNDERPAKGVNALAHHGEAEARRRIGTDAVAVVLDGEMQRRACLELAFARVRRFSKISTLTEPALPWRMAFVAPSWTQRSAASRQAPARAPWLSFPQAKVYHSASMPPEAIALHKPGGHDRLRTKFDGA